MKKLLTLTAIGLCLASLVGCSSSNNASASHSSSDQPALQASQQDSKSTADGSQGGRKGQAVFNNQELLSLLNTDSNALQSELQAGKSLADVAKEKGVEEQQVIDLMVKQSDQRTADLIKSGKMTQDQANQMKSKEQDRIKQEVERKGGFTGNGGNGGKGKDQHRQNNGDKLSSGTNNG